MRAARAGLAAVALLALPAALAAQDAARYWIAAGPATGGAADGGDTLGLMGQLAYQTGPHQFTLRGVVLLELFSTNDTSGELGVLYGRAATGYLGHASLSAGLAHVTIDRTFDDQGIISTVGVPIAGEVVLRMLPVLGLGMQGFANLNTESIYGGLALFVQLGWLP